MIALKSSRLGVIAMFGSLLILLILPITDLSRIRGSQFRPLMKIALWSFFVNFFILTWIGAMHPETPYLEIGQISTIFYFAWFLIIVPIIGMIENTLFDLSSSSTSSEKKAKKHLVLSSSSEKKAISKKNVFLVLQ